MTLDPAALIDEFESYGGELWLAGDGIAGRFESAVPDSLHQQIELARDAVLVELLARQYPVVRSLVDRYGYPYLVEEEFPEDQP